MSIRPLILSSVAALALTASAYASPSTFGLAGSIGQAPTFSITASTGLTATYSSTAGNMFAVQDTTGLLSFNTALLDNNFGDDPLTITFSSPIYGISLPFAILDAFGSGDSLTVTTNTGQTATFAGVSDGLILQEPEGNVNLSFTLPTTSVTFDGTNAFAIGDVVSTTPEPSSIALLATGLAGVATRLRRRKL